MSINHASGPIRQSALHGPGGSHRTRRRQQFKFSRSFVLEGVSRRSGLRADFTPVRYRSTDDLPSLGTWGFTTLVD